MDVECVNRCCGIAEIDGLAEYRWANKAFDNFLMEHIQLFNIEIPRNLYLFSQASGGRNGGYGIRFAAFIKRHNFGELVSLREKQNPNSGNKLKVWMWQPNWKEINRYMRTKEFQNFVKSRDEYVFEELYPAFLREVARVRKGLF